MKRILMILMSVTVTASVFAQEFQSIPRVWKWLGNEEVIFSYLGTYQGHSLSMSDIVELEEDIVSSRGATTMKGCYFCDSVGFKNIKFDTDKCEKMDGLRTLMILPHEKPIETRVVDELESWQKAVSRQGEDSMMEVTYPFEDNAVVVGNEEAKLIGMEGNRRFGESIYAGPLFIVNELINISSISLFL